LAEIGPLNRLLQNYLNATEGSEAVFIVRRDGAILTSIVQPGYEEKEIATLTTLIGYIADVTYIDFQTGYFRKSVQQISTEGRGFVFRQINSDHVLITICEERADRRVLTAYSVFVANKIEKILKGEIPLLDVPKSEERMREELKPKSEFVFKVVIIGDGGVGKTTLTINFAHGRFESEYKPTIGVSIVKNEYWIEDNLVNFQIWDIAGQALWKDMRRIYYGGAQGCLILYDVTRPTSFKNVEYWKTELKTFIQKEIPCILCANKIDLTELRKISRDEGEKLATDLGISYVETSAKTAENIDLTFLKLGKKLIEDYGK
jgi:small GTP-binding protein